MKKLILFIVLILCISNNVFAEDKYGFEDPNQYTVEELKERIKGLEENLKDSTIVEGAGGQLEDVLKYAKIALEKRSKTENNKNTKNSWVQENGNWYYYENNIKVTSKWVEYKSNWYYLGKDGKMLTNTTTPDGYKVDKEGKWIK